jgi:peptide/nickel transport system substrate-binding protein
LRQSWIGPAAAALVVSLALAGCSSGGQASGSQASGDQGASGAAAGFDPDATIVVGSQNEPTSLNSIGGGSSGVTEALYLNVYESLFSLDDEGQIHNLLAEDYSVSDDGLTYTFTLRQGVTFHSGKPLTPEDVKWSIERVISPESKAARKGDLEVIDSVTTSGDDTVTVTLSQKKKSLIYYLAGVWILQRDLADPATAEDGTGPYKLDQWKKGDSLTISRFDGYWGEKPTNAGVTFRYFTDATALNNALVARQIDIVSGEPSPDYLEEFQDASQYTIVEGQSTVKDLLAFNDRVEPFTDVRVRQAVSSAIDKKALLDKVWNGYGQVTGSMVPPKDPWYEDLSDVNGYDPDRAKELLAEAGYPDGFSFTLETPNYDPHPAEAEFIKSELAKVGIDVTINTITSDTWYETVYSNHDFEATLQEHVNDRDLVWFANPDFYWGYDNTQVQEWVDQSEAVDTDDEQTELLRKANETVTEEAAAVWLFLAPQLRVSTADVSGYPKNGYNSQFFVGDITKSS